MRALFRALGWLFVALGLMAVGADVYWSWKAGAWSFQPIEFYLRLADPHGLEAMRATMARESPRALRILNEIFAWPIWAPAFVIGLMLVTVTAPHERVTPQRGRIWSERRR